MPIDLEHWDELDIVPDIKEEYIEQDIPSISNFENFALAMAYVPWQRWREKYDYEEAFQAGTIFKELDLPFKGYKGGMSK